MTNGNQQCPPVSGAEVGRKVGRGINKLSARFVETAKKAGRHSDGGGLYLLVDKTGAKRWVFMFVRGGRRTELGLGSLTAIGLVKARQLAAQAREAIATGKDPRTVRGPSGGAVVTFGTAADAYIDAQAPRFRNAKHLDQWRMTLGDTYCASLRRIPVHEVGVDNVLAVLSPIWLTKAETASRLRGRIERVLDAARVRCERTGENPARWRGHLSHLLPKHNGLVRGHHRALPWQEMPTFMARLRAVDTMAAHCLEFVILTTARTGEAINAEWPEIIDDVWTVPPERMKAGREHRVPLCRRALAIIESHRGISERWVFPGQRLNRPLSNMALLKLLRDMKVDATSHGFRSTFRDWAGDQTAYAEEVIEMCLAHTVGNKVRLAYRRGDMLDARRLLMDDWAKFLA